LFLEAARFPAVLDAGEKFVSFLSRYATVPLSFLNVLPFVPLTMASVYAILTMNRGYLVHMTEKDAVFVSGEFLKALRFASRLTPHEHFRKKGRKP